jgi:putative restriction endonuclease
MRNSTPGSDADALIQKFTKVQRWGRGEQRAPHKPLLLLAALVRVQRGEERLIRYVELEDQLRPLLEEYSPAGRAQRPHYPFWRLQKDGLWEVPDAPGLTENRSGDVSPVELRALEVHGGFPQMLHQRLRDDPDLVDRVAAEILMNCFPASLHEHLLDAVGMPFRALPGARRDPAFRADVLRIYDYTCAVCGYDGRLARVELAIEAAHIRWFAYGGPCEPSNGLALCTFHHQALDRGAIGVDADYSIIVSQEVHGGPVVNDWLIRYHAARLRAPQPGTPMPAQHHLEWHRSEVFRIPARAGLAE